MREKYFLMTETNRIEYKRELTSEHDTKLQPFLFM